VNTTDGQKLSLALLQPAAQAMSWHRGQMSIPAGVIKDDAMFAPIALLEGARLKAYRAKRTA